MRFTLLLILASSLNAAGCLNYVRSEGNVLEDRRDWDAASAVYQDALRRCGSEIGGHGRVWLLTTLGQLSFQQGNYSDARRWLRQASAALATMPAASRVQLQLQNASAALHLVEGKLALAESELLAAASTAERLADRQALASALHNLASVEMQTGRLAAAEEHQRRALGVWRAELGDRNETVMRAWISLSSVQGLRGEWRAAEQSLLAAVAIAETPEALANYAVVLDQLKRGKEAKAIRRRLPPATPLPAAIDIRALPYGGQPLRARSR